MRKFHKVLAGTAGVLGLMAAGCSKSEPSPQAPSATPAPTATTAPAPTPAPTATPAPPAPSPEVAAPAPAATPANPVQDAAAAAAAAKAAAEQTAAETAQRFQTLVDAAKQMITEKKYQDALSALSKFSGLQLAPDQQKTVDGLKAQAQKLLATDAAKTVGGLVEGKKP